MAILISHIYNMLSIYNSYIHILHNVSVSIISKFMFHIFYILHHSSNEVYNIHIEFYASVYTYMYYIWKFLYRNHYSQNIASYISNKKYKNNII